MLTTLGVGALLWSGTLRADATPYGDGSRIMKWLATVVRPGEPFPTWNPFRNGGYPLFADPEQFWILIPFVDPGSLAANLQLNMALFAGLLVPLVPAWLLARRLGLDGRWSVVAAVLVGFNEAMIIVEQSARIAGLINVASFLGTLALLARKRLDLLSYALLVFCVGVALAVAVQYALLQGAVVYSVFLFGPQADWTRPVRHLLSATGRAAAVGFGGAALAAVVLVPAFGHLGEAHSFLTSVQYPPILLDQPYEILRLVIPYIPSMNPILLSLLVVPATVLAAIFGVPDQLRIWVRGMSLPLAIAAVFVLMCLPLVGPLVQSIYSKLPFISSVRQFGIAAITLAVLTTLAAVMLFQCHGTRRLAEVGRAGRMVLGGYCASAGLAAFAFGHLDASDAGAITTGLSGLLLVSAAGYLFATGFGWAGLIRTEASTITTAGMTLTALTILIVAPMAFQERHAMTGRNLHVPNSPELPEFFKIVTADDQGYFRFVPEVPATWFLNAHKRGGAAFSLHYPEGQAYTFSYLSAKSDPDVQRPHWVKPLRCADLDSRALDLLAVKYLFCRERNVRSYSPPGFVRAGSEGGWILFRRVAPSALLRVFCHWRQSPLGDPREVREEALTAFARGEALLDIDGADLPRDPDCPNGGLAEAKVAIERDAPNEMVLEVDTAQAGVVVIPDNFAPGWSASVNGLDRSIIRAFDAYRGIPLERGKNRVRLVYHDRYLAAGLTLSAVTVALLVLAGAVGVILRVRRGGLLNAGKGRDAQNKGLADLSTTHSSDSAAQEILRHGSGHERAL